MKGFKADAIERAVKTIIQAALVTLPAVLGPADLRNWQALVWTMGAGAAGGLLSLLMSWASTRKGDPDTAAFLSAEADTPEPMRNDARPHPRPAPRH